MAKGYNTRGSRRNGKLPPQRQPINPGTKLDIQRTLVWALAYAADHMGQGAADQLLGLTGNPGLRADVDACKALVTRLAAVMSGNGNLQQGMYPFTLTDVYDPAAKHVFGVVRYGLNGLGISIDGYSEKTAGNGEGMPIWLEMAHGSPVLRVWGDINEENPTHEISLEGAAESLRIPDEPQGDEDGQEQESQEEAGEDAGVSSDGDEHEAVG